jgi:hypothetical protein
MATASPASATPNPAFAALKAKLAAVAAPPTRIESSISSSIPELDRLLGGGFPAGALVVLEGTAGRWSVATRLLAGVTLRSVAAIVDDGALYPPDLVRAGARLDRVLVVPATLPLTIARAADVLVRSKACKVVVMPAPDLRAQVWTRLAGLAHRAGVLLIAIPPAHVSAAVLAPLTAAAGVRLLCTRECVAVAGKRGLWCSFAGYDVCAELRKHPWFVPERRAQLRVRDDRAGDRVRMTFQRSTIAHAAVR